MLRPVGESLPVDQPPGSMLRAFAITARATGRDILAHLTRSGRSLHELAITDFDLIERLSRRHPEFDRTGAPNLFLADDVSMLSAVRAVGRRKSPLVIERVALHSRVPWRNGRVFGLLRNPLA